MGENGHHNRETGKGRQETDGQEPGDDQSPKLHGERLHQRGLDGSCEWTVTPAILDFRPGSNIAFPLKLVVLPKP